MDDRKRQIDELEKKKRENSALLDGLLLRLGEEMFRRIPDSAKEDPSSPDELNTYLRLQKDIAGSEAAISIIEEQIKKMKEVEEKISNREREEKACSKELSRIYGDLGKLLLDSPPQETGGDYCAPYRSQAEALNTKVQSLEDRVSGLEQKDGGNVFTWIGNSAQALVLRSFLTKAGENLALLRRNVGERYIRDMGGGRETGMSFEILSMCENIERKRAESKAVTQDLAALKQEKQTMTAHFNADGNPVKQIHSLKKHIAGVRENLKNLYRNAGAEVSGTIVPSINTDANTGTVSADGYFIASLVIPEDQEIIDNAGMINRSIQNDEKSIERLRASLAIDEELAKIEKFHRMILEKREKITQAEKSIADYEEGIADCESYIEKLKELL